MDERDGLPDDPVSNVAETLALTGRHPREALAVFGRYGRPLDPSLNAAEVSDEAFANEVALPLGADRSATVRVLALRTAVDVIANHWLVLDAPPDEPLAVAGPLYAAALGALTRARS